MTRRRLVALLLICGAVLVVAFSANQVRLVGLLLTGKWRDDSAAAALSRDSEAVSAERVAQWIKSQGKRGTEGYYLEGLIYEWVDADADAESELLARTNGGVHTGDFFVFDRVAGGAYDLVSEMQWKVESWHRPPLSVGGQRLFELVTRDGGVGADVLSARLVYVDQGKMHEAWAGVLLEHAAGLPDSCYRKAGSYQVDESRGMLYSWETLQKLGPDAETPVGQPVTTFKTLVFDGQRFSER